MKKKWIILLYAIVILAALGISAYEYHTKQTLDKNNLIRTLLIIAGAVSGMIKTLNRGKGAVPGTKKAVYSKAYKEQIGTAFVSYPKEEKLFYRALDDFNKQNFSAAVKKLLTLEEACRGTAEQRAITFFIGRNYQRAGEYEKALPYYERCVNMGGHASAAANLADCYSELGDLDKEWDNLLRAVRMDPTYVNGHNNIGQFLIRMGEYEEAIPPLLEAHRLNGNLPQALSGLAVCYAMTDRKEQYEKAMHMLVALGENGNYIKEFIRSLEPPFEVEDFNYGTFYQNKGHHPSGTGLPGTG